MAVGRVPRVGVGDADSELDLPSDSGQEAEHREGLLVKVPFGHPQGLEAGLLGDTAVLPKLFAALNAVIEDDAGPSHPDRSGRSLVGRRGYIGFDGRIAVVFLLRTRLILGFPETALFGEMIDV